MLSGYPEVFQFPGQLSEFYGFRRGADQSWINCLAVHACVLHSFLCLKYHNWHHHF